MIGVELDQDRVRKNRVVLRGMVDDKENTFFAPGVGSPRTARIFAGLGFDVLYMSGFATVAEIYGLPDYGFVGREGMVRNAKNIGVIVPNTPLIADADTGYGDDAVQAWHTVLEYERAGIAAIHMEDQLGTSKRCGHMAGKIVDEGLNFYAKIRGGLRARQDPNFVFIARTDVFGSANIPEDRQMDEVLRRIEGSMDAGADMMFVEGWTTVEQAQTFRTVFPEVPFLANMIYQGRTPYNFTRTELKQLGFRGIIRPLESTFAHDRADELVAMHFMNNDGSSSGLESTLVDFATHNEYMGLPDLQKMADQIRLEALGIQQQL